MLLKVIVDEFWADRKLLRGEIVDLPPKFLKTFPNEFEEVKQGKNEVHKSPTKDELKEIHTKLYKYRKSELVEIAHKIGLKSTDQTVDSLRRSIKESIK